MRIALFCHSLRSDWNHGNAHFLRGVVSDLVRRGHDVRVFEPAGGWSAAHLVADHGVDALMGFARHYPAIAINTYSDDDRHHLDTLLDGVDVAIVHEWSPPWLVAEVGAWRSRHAARRALFHDTHHRSVTQPAELARYDLREYDGVLAFGECIRQEYLRRGWAARVWTWHEAADVTVFHPISASPDCDLIWIGNWGDDERAVELTDFLIRPIAGVGLRARIHGVRYPEHAIGAIRATGAAYCGWLANYDVPAAFARARLTVHVPRRPYVTRLPGVPTIRVFEALACGLPLVSAPWDDTEGLFRSGRDFIVARTSTEMADHLRRLVHDADERRARAADGLATVRARHTCAHRVDELLQILASLGMMAPATAAREVTQ